MKLRKIKTKILLLQGLLYRAFVIATETTALWIYTKQFTLALGASLAMNVVRMSGYYLFHYVFARIFRMGTKNEQ